MMTTAEPRASAISATRAGQNPADDLRYCQRQIYQYRQRHARITRLRVNMVVMVAGIALIM